MVNCNIFFILRHWKTHERIIKIYLFHITVYKNSNKKYHDTNDFIYEHTKFIHDTKIIFFMNITNLKVIFTFFHAITKC